MASPFGLTTFNSIIPSHSFPSAGVHPGGYESMQGFLSPILGASIFSPSFCKETGDSQADHTGSAIPCDILSPR